MRGVRECPSDRLIKLDAMENVFFAA